MPTCLCDEKLCHILKIMFRFLSKKKRWRYFPHWIHSRCWGKCQSLQGHLVAQFQRDKTISLLMNSYFYPKVAFVHIQGEQLQMNYISCKEQLHLDRTWLFLFKVLVGRCIHWVLFIFTDVSWFIHVKLNKAANEHLSKKCQSPP